MIPYFEFDFELLFQDADLMKELDIFDNAILRIIRLNGRISVTELAKRVNLSKSPTQVRLRRLQETGYIHGVTWHFILRLRIQ